MKKTSAPKLSVLRIYKLLSHIHCIWYLVMWIITFFFLNFLLKMTYRLLALTSPEESWVAKWQKISKWYTCSLLAIYSSHVLSILSSRILCFFSIPTFNPVLHLLTINTSALIPCKKDLKIYNYSKVEKSKWRFDCITVFHKTVFFFYFTKLFKSSFFTTTVKMIYSKDLFNW